jgi:hypothetical protein
MTYLFLTNNQLHQEDIPKSTSLSPAADDASPQEPPKSPWTPSYSVTTQGPGTPGEEKELDNIEPLPQRVLDANSAKDAVTYEDVKAAFAISSPTTDKAPVEEVVAGVEESKPNPVIALERELQGMKGTAIVASDVTPVANVSVVDAAQQEYFPTVETTDAKSKLSK